MEDITVFGALKDAIRTVYLESGSYFKPTKGRERSIVFRIAHELANRIEDKLNLHVDIEPTRCNGITKRAEAIIVPDLVVHKRGGKGHLAVEFKCTHNISDKEHDCAKLSLLTLEQKDYALKKCCPTYNFGAFVYLANTLDKVEITIFVNGCERDVIKGL